jgi:mannose-1-phosphate guanylyltransferase
LTWFGYSLDVSHHKKTQIGDCDVFVLAGGLGTRIRGVLGPTPKVLAPIRGRPYIELLFEWLQRYGVRRVVLGLGQGARLVEEYLQRNPGPDLAIEASVEGEPLGTAGALRLARPKLRTDPVLVMNGDGIIECDLDALMASHRDSGRLVTMVVTRVEDGRRYGRVRVDHDAVTGFAEKDPQAEGPALVNAGVYLFSGELLDRVSAGDAVSLEHDVFARMAPGSIAAFASSGRFVDIGTPESLRQANSADDIHDFR